MTGAHHLEMRQIWSFHGSSSTADQMTGDQRGIWGVNSRPRWGNVRDLQFFIRADIFTFPDLFVRYIYICAYYCFQWNKIPWWASPQHHHCLSLTSSTSSFQETRQVESSSAYSACDSDQVFDVDDQLVTLVEIIVIEMIQMITPLI